MKIAISLAKERIGLTGSNPSVGCVVVKDNEIISALETELSQASRELRCRVSSEAAMEDRCRSLTEANGDLFKAIEVERAKHEEEGRA